MSCLCPELASAQFPLQRVATSNGLGQQPPQRTIAVTIDDLPTISVLGPDLESAQRTTKTLLAALRRNGVPAIGFVNGGKLQPAAKSYPRRVALLQQWLDAGMELGNHTYGHLDLNTTPLERYERDVLDGERVLRRLLAARGTRPEFFRHPFLHTGRTLEVKHSFEAFLRQHGYRVAPVTVDNYDFIFAAAYDRAGARADAAMQKRIADAYIDYMNAAIAFYEAQSVKIVGREMAQTLLIHASALNAETFDRLAEMMRRRGYRFITLREALKDPAYDHRDEYVGPAGITWLHRWAMADAQPSSIFVGEPVVPDWIQQAAK